MVGSNKLPWSIPTNYIGPFQQITVVNSNELLWSVPTNYRGQFQQTTYIGPFQNFFSYFSVFCSLNTWICFSFFFLSILHEKLLRIIRKSWQPRFSFPKTTKPAIPETLTLVQRTRVSRRKPKLPNLWSPAAASLNLDSTLKQMRTWSTRRRSGTSSTGNTGTWWTRTRRTRAGSTNTLHILR